MLQARKIIKTARSRASQGESEKTENGEGIQAFDGEEILLAIGCLTGKQLMVTILEHQLLARAGFPRESKWSGLLEDGGGKQRQEDIFKME